MRQESAEKGTGVPSVRDSWRMFDRIAPRYDLLNRLLSMRRDVAWRRRLARHLPEGNGLRVLDLATGTADVALSLCRQGARVASVVGVDMSAQMLALAGRKVRDLGLGERIRLVRGDAARLGLHDYAFDAVTIAFGIRNVPDVDEALREMHRVLRPGGRALVLEFSLPEAMLMRRLYLLYFRHVLPRIGGAVSGDREAYRYLNTTVEDFPYGQAFCDRMSRAGFRQVVAHPLTFGIATLYQGET